MIEKGKTELRKLSSTSSLLKPVTTQKFITVYLMVRNKWGTSKWENPLWIYVWEGGQARERKGEVRKRLSWSMIVVFNSGVEL